MKKYILSSLLIFTFLSYVLYTNTGNPPVATATPSAQPNSSDTTSNSTNQPVSSNNAPPQNTTSASSANKTKSTSAPKPVTSPPPANTGLYKNGVYTGDSTDAFYGNIQVQAIIQNGQLADVQFLDYPQDRSNSIRINTRAMPILKTEAIQAQNANVDIVSGATDSSGAFRVSLASALTQAAK